MLASFRRLLYILTPWLLGVVLIGCLTGPIISFVHNPALLNFLWAILAIIAFYLVCLFPIFIWLAIALFFFSPVFLFLFLNSLFRRYKRKKAERIAYQQLEELYQQLPLPVTPPQEQFIPLMQRRFKH